MICKEIKPTQISWPTYICLVQEFCFFKGSSCSIIFVSLIFNYCAWYVTFAKRIIKYFVIGPLTRKIASRLRKVQGKNWLCYYFLTSSFLQTYWWYWHIEKLSYSTSLIKRINILIDCNPKCKHSLGKTWRSS